MQFKIKRARRGLMRRNQWFFVIRTDNERTLATSETYNNKADCQHAIGIIKREAAEAPTWSEK